jgi:integrase
MPKAKPAPIEAPAGKTESRVVSTDTQCKSATCPPGKAFVRYWDSGGLYLQVTQTGAKLWRWKYRFQGKEGVLAIGKYPLISLKAAREAGGTARKLLDSGVDPGADKQAKKRVDPSIAAQLFETIARKWHANWQTNKVGKHAGYVIRRMEKYVFPVIGAMPIATITAPMLVNIAKAAEENDAPEVARRVLHTSSQVFRYAIAHGLTERNPATDVKPGDVLKPRTPRNHARIERNELPGLLRSIAAYRGTPYTRYAMELMTHTFLRTSELICARWGEIDFEKAQWRIPKERMKKKRNEHIVPLAPQVVEIFKTMQCIYPDASRYVPTAYVFPGDRDPEKPISNNTILAALARMGYKGIMTGHGFRGVASTELNEMGYSPDVIEAQLAHVERNKVRAAYNHAQYLDQRTAMMRDWANYLAGLRGKGSVTPIGKAKKSQAA